MTWEFSIRSGEDISSPDAAIAEIDDWRLHLWDYGMYRLVGTAPNQSLERLKDIHGNDLTAPRLLDGSGGILAIGQKPKLLRSPLGFPQYKAMPFGALGLPTSF